jgi:type IV secretion system protein VirD4
MLKKIYQGVFIARTVSEWLKTRERRQENEGHFLEDRARRTLLSPKHDGLLLDGDKARLDREDSFRNLAMIATTGAGKTASFIVPNLLALDNCSIVATDPSGSLYDRTAGDLARRGYTVLRLEPKDLAGSIRYNPLARAESTPAQQEIAHVLIQTSNRGGKPTDPFWTNGAEEILGILIKCLKNHVDADRFANLANVQYLLNNFGDGEALAPFVAANAPDDATYFAFKGFITQSEKTMQGIVSQAKAALTMMADLELAALTASSSFNFERLRTEKIALFLVIPQNRVQYYSGLMSLFYTDLFHFCLDDEVFARQSKSSGGNRNAGTNGILPVYFLLDEFGHLTIPAFPSIITTTRQRKISLSIVLQSLSQLEERYGPKGAQTIIDGGIASRLFFSGMDIDTATMLSRTIGEARTDHLDALGRPHTSREPVMSAAALRAMPDTDVLYLFANKRPTLLNVTPYYRRSDFSKRAEQAPKIPRRSNIGVPSPVAYVPL